EAVWREPWVVHCTAWGNGADAVLEYLARYVYRVAITNSRIIGLNAAGVTIRHRERASGRLLHTRLTGHEFMRRYGRALGSFFAFLDDGGRAGIQDIGPLDVRDYLEAAKANGLSTATLKQHMAAIRMLFDHLVTGAVLEHNPALSVKAPRQKLGKGKTPVLTAEEAGELLRSINTDDVLGLRDRALIGVMVFTFARVSAACGMNVADIFHQQRRL